MIPPNEIRTVWQTFDRYPMETLTKAWWGQRTTRGSRQRDVATMETHRRELGATGNCFDLVIWLLHRFHVAGVEAYPVGHYFTSLSI